MTPNSLSTKTNFTCYLDIKYFMNNMYIFWSRKMFAVVLFLSAERKIQHRALIQRSVIMFYHFSCFHMPRAFTCFFPLMFLDAMMMKWGPKRPSLDSSRVFSFFAEKPDVRSESSWDEIADVSVFWLFSFQRTDLHPISHHLIMCLPALARVCERKKESERKEKKGRQTGSGAKGLFW